MKIVLLDLMTRLHDMGLMIPFFLWSRKHDPDTGMSQITIRPNMIRIIEGVMIAVITAVLSVVATTWIMTSNLQIQQKNSEADIIEHNIRMKTIEDKVSTLCGLMGVVNERVNTLNERQQERLRREAAHGYKW